MTAGVAFVVAIASCGACGLRRLPDACSQGDGLEEDAYRGGSLAAGSLALTVDGVPNGGVVEFLTAETVTAAFFVTGAGVRSEAATLRRLKDGGHLVGVAGYTGRPLASVPQPVSELRKADQLVAPFITGGIHLLRPEGGGLDGATLQRLNDAGLSRYVGPIGWDAGPAGAGLAADAVGAASCGAEAADDCASRYLAAIRAVGRGIVALAVAASELEATLKILVPKLRAEGYSFVRLDAVDEIATAVRRSGGVPGAVGGGGGCVEY